MRAAENSEEWDERFLIDKEIQEDDDFSEDTEEDTEAASEFEGRGIWYKEEEDDDKSLYFFVAKDDD